MSRKTHLCWAVVLLCVFIISGCETITGAAKGAVEGMQKDWAVLKKADDWLKKNLW
jgi:predicted small secreted protein